MLWRKIKWGRGIVNPVLNSVVREGLTEKTISEGKAKRYEKQTIQNSRGKII